MAEEDMSKTAFRCPGFLGLFEWTVMTFGLKNAGATYQRAMNLIFHDLLGVILEVYIDDIVVKSDAFESHLADATCRLRWYFPEEERMMQYSRDKYFPQLRTKVINPVGEPSKIPLSAPAHTKANTCTQRK